MKSVILPDGFVALYDLERSLGSTLSPEAAVIWELCDGEHQLSDMIIQIEELTGQSVDREAVSALLDRLSQDGFLLVR